MSTFFISDLHFGHLNMAIKRGFTTVEEHDNHIIKCWNRVVHKKDTVYLLGDITMERDTYSFYLPQLKGYKKVVSGNHDKPQHVSSLLRYVNSVCSSFYVKNKEFGNFILSHIPIHPTELSYRYGTNIHGHVHEKTLEDSRYINVSCEVIDFTPQTLEQLIDRQFKKE